MTGDDTATILTKSLSILDPLLQLFTKATGKTMIPLAMLCSAIPESNWDALDHIPELVQRGILSIDYSQRGDQQNSLSQENWTRIIHSFKIKETNNKNSTFTIGFPPPFLHQKGKLSSRVKTNLHASTKTAAKKRLTALKRSLKSISHMISRESDHQIVDAETSDVTEKKQNDTRLSINLFKSEGKDVMENQLSSKCIQQISRKETPNGLIDRQEYKEYSVSSQQQNCNIHLIHDNEDYMSQSAAAFKVLHQFFPKSNSRLKNIETKNTHMKPTSDNSVSHFQILEGQAAYAGTNPARKLRHGNLSTNSIEMIPKALSDALELSLISSKGQGSTGNIGNKKRQLYYHQAVAIDSIMNEVHTLICTGTGSGKSLCFLLPVLAQVMNSDVKERTNNSGENDSHTALIMFPTKALAQDQLTKLNVIVKSHPDLEMHIRPGVIDGDTPHQNRDEIAKNCNIILTNPDTLHAAILPGWTKSSYRSFLKRVSFICLDELHIYDGAFGAHVSLVLTRLRRIIHSSSSKFCSQQRNPVFIGCSATIGHPEDHFRLLCPILPNESVFVLGSEDDGSPCAAKHYFVWNPPLLDIQGDSTGQIMPSKHMRQHSPEDLDAKNSFTRKRKKKSKSVPNLVMKGRSQTEIFAAAGLMELAEFQDLEPFSLSVAENKLVTNEQQISPNALTNHFFRRRHAADETATLLAEAMRRNIRCIAFCKTRMLVEWVYEKCIAILKSDSQSEQLVSKVESYRGGYSANIRRSIEHRLFRNEIIAVVATSALELGVDIGGIDLTLHCGYPGSISSLLQQSGRAGRGGKTNLPSCAIMVCFSSPSEQYIWKNPKGLMSRGLSAPPSLPLNVGIVQGHLLCAGSEFPLTGDLPITTLLGTNDTQNNSGERRIKKYSFPPDSDLFGSKEIYEESARRLLTRGSLVKEFTNFMNKEQKSVKLQILKSHPVS